MFNVFDELKHKEVLCLVKYRCVLEAALIESKLNKGIISSSTNRRLNSIKKKYELAQNKVHSYLVSPK